MKKSICVISFSPIYRDARVLRQIKYLSPHYDLIVIGFGHPHPAWEDKQNIKWISIDVDKDQRRLMTSFTARALPLLGRLWPSSHDNWYWRKSHFRQALERAVSSGCDAFHANDWEALPVAAEAARRNNARLVFDAHEYSPLMYESNWRWMLYRSPTIKHLLREYTPIVDASTTVAPLIAERYNQEFSLNPIVVFNAPDSIRLPSSELDPHNIRLIHHGSAMRDRRLEAMIETLALCDRRYSLHLMLVDHTPGYLQHLGELADELAPDRVTFHDPVAPEEIVQRISEYDVGLYLLEPTSYNNTVALPNKFFDFIAAGLAVCVGPSPSMAELVRQYGFGCVTPSFEPCDAAETLNRLSVDQLEAMQQAARQAAQQFNAEKEMGKVLELYRRLL
jgi:hypothetical protein